MCHYGWNHGALLKQLFMLKNKKQIHVQSRKKPHKFIKLKANMEYLLTTLCEHN